MSDFDDEFDEQDTPTVCECCGQRIRKLNPHHIDRQKLHVLLDLWKARQDGGDCWCKMYEGEYMEVLLPSGVISKRRTAYLARTHAMRLAWFGLTEWRGPRTGEWRISPVGLTFLQGQTDMPRTLWCRDGAVVKVSEERCTIREAYQLLLDKEYWDRYPEWQRTLAELEGKA